MRCLLDRNVLKVKSKYDRGTCPSISIFFTSCVGTVIRYAHIKVRMFQNAHLSMHDKVLVFGYEREKRPIWFDLSMNDKSMKKVTKVWMTKGATCLNSSQERKPSRSRSNFLNASSTCNKFLSLELSYWRGTRLLVSSSDFWRGIPNATNFFFWSFIIGEGFRMW